MIPVAEERAGQDVFRFIGGALTVLWRGEWLRDMIAKDVNPSSFTLTGTCPYPDCKLPSLFTMVTQSIVGSFVFNSQNGNRTAAIMQCQACQKYILALVWNSVNSSIYRYLEHFPIGAPDQEVAEEVPQHIKEDFQEALRCVFVEAYNATVEMCRRALEAACIQLGAPKDKVLERMIDCLEANRKITPYLKDAAHKIRLGGNRGAHPNPDGPPDPTVPEDPNAPVEKIEKEHAEAIIAFTREFFHHVYVGPKMLGKYDFSKPKAVSK